MMSRSPRILRNAGDIQVKYRAAILAGAQMRVFSTYDQYARRPRLYLILEQWS